MEYPSFLSSFASSEERDWAWLPENVLFLIISHMFLLSDMFSFGSVCTHWKSAFEYRLRELKIQPNMSFRKGLPMLLTPTGDSSSEFTRNLYSVPDAVIYDLKLPVPFNNSKGTIHVPPFEIARTTSERMKEIGREFFCDYFICKAILSSDPSSCTNNYILVVIYGEMRKVAYYSSNNTNWTCIKSQEGIFDIISYEGNFLSVDFWGEAYLCEAKPTHPKVDLVTEPVMGPLGGATRRYIVKASDDTILQAVRLVECTLSRTGEAVFNTYGFLVYKLVNWSENPGWIPLTSIEDGALFVGDNHSTYVKASNYPGIIANAIYFTADYCDDYSMFHRAPQFYRGLIDSGIFRLADDSFLHHYISFPNNDNPPIWMLPTI